MGEISSEIKGFNTWISKVVVSLALQLDSLDEVEVFPA
jgi:hypothetical protein